MSERNVIQKMNFLVESPIIDCVTCLEQTYTKLLNLVVNNC